MSMTLPAGVTVALARRAVAARLRQQNMDTPELDARILVGAATHLDLTGLMTNAERPLDAPARTALEGFVARRLAGEPVARILGVREFYGLPMRLSAATLVPRPETEILVDVARETLSARALPAPRLADIGTGTGAIALALLHECPEATVIATDCSAEALATARANAEALGVGARLTTVLCDYTAALAGPFDLIVSNPPYIPSDDIAGLAPEVRLYDPLRALDGGPDGLAAYRVLAREALRLLAPGGAVVVEVGQGQAEAVQSLMAGNGLTLDMPPRPDFQGIPRVVRARHDAAPIGPAA